MVRQPEIREQRAFITSRAGERGTCSEPTENTSPGGSDLAGCWLPVRGPREEQRQSREEIPKLAVSHTRASKPTRSQQSGSGERGAGRACPWGIEQGRRKEPEEGTCRIWSTHTGLPAHLPRRCSVYVRVYSGCYNNRSFFSSFSCNGQILSSITFGKRAP